MTDQGLQPTDPGGPGPGGEDRSRRSLWRRYRDLSLGIKIFIYMIAGVLFGIFLPEQAIAVKPVGDLFIRLLLMAAIPLVFFNLLAGLTSLEGLGILGRLGGKVIAYYFATTTIALILGLTIMSILRPGDGMELRADDIDEESLAEVPGVVAIVFDLFPENIIRAFSQGNLAQIVIFAIFLGIAVLLLPDKHKAPISQLVEALAAALRKLVEIIMKMGPIGIGALMASTVGEHGQALFGPLLLFLAGIWLAQACMFVIQMVALTTLSSWTPWPFLKKTGPLYATAAGTCSSLATLAVAIDLAANRLKLPRKIYSFTLPLGAQLNKDGTALMLTGVLLFTAQAVGVEFTIGEMLIIILVGLILSEGSGGIPGGGAVIALIFVNAFNLPPEIAGIVVGIYRLIDMGNTTINVTGDMVATTIIAESEGWDKDNPDPDMETDIPAEGAAEMLPEMPPMPQTERE
ncbi:MAG: dicarboxylate/amino acid:cation symporter [Phycisphaerales bacterium]|nr:MAG: dicarboxylate/amino acid:cation symporter [Phycisphaerales bacterium]